MSVQSKLYSYSTDLQIPVYWFGLSKAVMLLFLDWVNCPNFQNICTMAEKTKEMKRKMHFKPKVCPLYSFAGISHALYVRYTSLQAYKLFLEIYFTHLFHKIQHVWVNSLKSVALLCKKGEISSGCIFMEDEMYLQKPYSMQASTWGGQWWQSI